MRPAGTSFHSCLDHFHHQPVEDLRDRVPGAEGHQSRHRAGRDFRPARAQRRRQDHADRHRLRHRESERRQGHRRRPRHHPRLPRGALADRAGAAGDHDGAVRDRLGGVTMSRGLFNKPKNPAYLEKVLKDLSLWDKRHAKIVELVRRHEAARSDRQGAEPRADDPVPRRADGRRRCRTAQGHVGRGARRCAPPASPSSSPRITSRKPRRWPTASASSTRAR